MTHSVMAVVTFSTSDAACRTVQLCLYQPAPGKRKGVLVTVSRL